MRKTILQALLEYRPRQFRNESETLGFKLNEPCAAAELRHNQQDIQDDETGVISDQISACTSELEKEQENELEDMLLDYELNKQLATNKVFAKSYYARQKRLEKGNGKNRDL